MLRRHRTMWLLIAIFAIGFITACSTDQPSESAESPPAEVPPASSTSETNQPVEEKPQIPEPTKEPIVLTMYQSGAAISDEEFERLIAGPVREAYPNIEMQIVRKDNINTPEALVAANNFPDMVFVGSRSLKPFLDLGLGTDLREIGKQFQYDFDIFDPVAIEQISAFGSNGELYAMPFSTNFAALFYNKAIFDLFAVPYPTDGMTYDEVIELAKLVARSDGGVQYKAINPNNFGNFGTVRSIPLVDPETNQSLLTSNEWAELASLYKRFNYDIPFNKAGELPGNVKAFVKDKTLAMYMAYGGILGDINQAIVDGTDLDWDVATYPQFEDMPGKMFQAVTHTMMMSSTTKYPVEVFHVMRLLATEEQQLKMTKGGRLSALKDNKMREHFAEDLPSTKGKNIQGIFKSVHVSGKMETDYDPLVRSELNAAVNKMIKEDLDVNTALAEAHEKATKAIQEAMAAK